MAMTGKAVCYMHGGKSLSGPAHPNWKTGEHSSRNYLPDRLRDLYDIARNDPELTSTKDATAVLESRGKEILLQLSSGESGAAWKAMRELVGQMKGLLTGEPK